MFINWADIDIFTSKSISLLSFAVYLYVYLRFQLSSSVRMLKVILALFVVGTCSQLGKMYLVPLAKESQDFDLLTMTAIVICTLSTSTNVANWLFATSYFNSSNKFEQILQNHSSQMKATIYATPVT